jgi:hypothetical protein
MKQGNLFGGPIDFSNPADITAGRHGGNPQSEAAHAKVQPTAAAERARVLEWLKHRGRGGGSRKEYLDYVNTCDGTTRGLNCVSGRFSELLREGLIAETGRTDAGSGIVVLKAFAG